MHRMEPAWRRVGDKACGVASEQSKAAVATTDWQSWEEELAEVVVHDTLDVAVVALQRSMEHEATLQRDLQVQKVMDEGEEEVWVRLRE